MPRKVKTPASVAQNRDNQRRSRTRQRELVEEMRKQLQEYERRGVEASLEMQRAAREVARENRRLRIMLAHRGILSEEIQLFLGLPDEVVDGMVLDETAQQVGTDTSSSPPRSPFPKPTQDLSAAPALPSPSSYAISSSRRQSEPSHTTSMGFRNEDEPLRQLSDLTHILYLCDEDSRRKRNGTSASDPYHPPDPSAPSTPRDSVTTPLETSCIAAVDIISELYGDWDAAEALLTLGCSGTSDCLIKNTRLFQLMDNAI
ncbi:hypothetical protein AAE478_008944 [Parahypoxylon ruwenzoriense]